MAKDAPSLPSDDPGRVETVSEFTRRVKALLEVGIQPGWVRGEVSNLRAQASGHVYFSLKDAGAQLACVLFRGDAMRQSTVLRDGLQVLANGEISVYEQRGQYQLIVRLLLEDGVGRLQQEFERLKQRLADEGLFDPARKRVIPAMPVTVGFITSPTGAAVQDFIRILQRRGWRGRLVVLPARVQGEGAAAEMSAMLKLAEALGIFDLLVIGRGGGSLEDLWAFNEESLVRAVAACPLPVISAVGHEIDFTISDFVADMRAPTPSAAAELVVGRKEDFAALLRMREKGLRQALRQQLTEVRGRLAAARASRALHAPRQAVEHAAQALDGFEVRLKQALSGASGRARRRCDAVHARLALLRGNRLQAVAGRLEALNRQLSRAAPDVLNRRRRQVEALERQLRALSPMAVLERGYSLTRDADGRLVRAARQVAPGARVSTQVADGVFESEVTRLNSE